MVAFDLLIHPESSDKNLALVRVHDGQFWFIDKAEGDAFFLTAPAAWALVKD